MTVGQVAERLDVSPQRVRQLDHELHPERCACGVRRYNPSTVAAYAAKRARDREQLSLERSQRMHALRQRLSGGHDRDHALESTR
ncbi:MAG: hypothetical protein ACREBE_12985 [bacterium]